MATRVKAHFIEPMLLRQTDTLPDDPSRWAYELKLDGYRAIAFRTDGAVHLRSRRNLDYAATYPAVVRGLADLPNESVIDGELVVFDEQGRPSFSALQHSARRAPVWYYVFDVMILDGEDIRREPRDVRRALLNGRVLPHLAEPVRYAGDLNAPLRDLIYSVQERGLEGLVAKRRDSRYEPGLRSGAWLKMRVNRSQEFVIGGYTLGTRAFDALIFGYYDGKRLLYAGRTRNGFTPALREQLFRRFRPLEISDCPFVNLPEPKSAGIRALTRDKMAQCRWLEPVLVGQFEFVEWTMDNHLRHSKFVGLREDKPARDVRRI